jgi:hypothetical protein
VYAGSAIAWPSQLQRSVALSVIEVEFTAASEGAKELLWLKHLLGELGGKGSEVPTLFVDNARAVKMAKNAAFNKRSKHVKAQHYFVPECYQNGRTGVEHIDGVNQIC